MRVRRSWVIGAVWTACLSGRFLFGGREEPTQLTFLGVGQGDCAVFQHRGHTVLVDAGPSSAEFDSGERVVAQVSRLEESYEPGQAVHMWWSPADELPLSQ